MGKQDYPKLVDGAIEYFQSKPVDEQLEYEKILTELYQARGALQAVQKYITEDKSV
jgi:hypothetical protein